MAAFYPRSTGRGKTGTGMYGTCLSGDKSKEELSKIRSKAERALKESRNRLGETGDAIAKQTREAAARADDYVRENPWTGVGIGAAVGVVLGVLLTRR